MRTADSTTPVRGSKTAQPSCHALPPTRKQVKELGHPRVQGPDRAVRVAIGRTASPPCSTPRSPLPDLGSHPHQGGVRGRTAPSSLAERRSCLPLRGGKKKQGSSPWIGGPWLALHEKAAPWVLPPPRQRAVTTTLGEKKKEKQRESGRGRESEKESKSENESENINVSASVSGNANVSVHAVYERKRERVNERELACTRASASSLARIWGQGKTTKARASA